MNLLPRFPCLGPRIAQSDLSRTKPRSGARAFGEIGDRLHRVAIRHPREFDTGTLEITRENELKHPVAPAQHARKLTRPPSWQIRTARHRHTTLDTTRREAASAGSGAGLVGHTDEKKRWGSVKLLTPYWVGIDAVGTPDSPSPISIICHYASRTFAERSATQPELTTRHRPSLAKHEDRRRSRIK